MSLSIHCLRKILTIQSLCPKHLNTFYPLTQVCQKRYIRSTAKLCVGAYEGDGQTTVSVINKEFTQGLLIDTVNQYGFRLNNNSQIVGPVVIFNKVILSWNILNDTDITMESLSLFKYLEPRLDVLIIGLSDFKKNSASLLKVLTEMRKYCNVEMLPTERAIATFNFMVSEGRVVGAALIPPAKISFSSDDIQITKQRQHDLYTLDFKQEFM